MKIIVLSPYCVDKSGHYFAYYTSFERVCFSLGKESVFFVSKECKIQGQESFKAFFRASKVKLFQIWYRFFDYAKILRKWGKKNTILLESYALSDLMAFIFASFFSRKTSFLLLFIRDGMEAYPKKRNIFFLFIKVLSRVYSGRFSLVTDSEKIEKSCSKNLNKPISILPIPHTSHCLRTEKNCEDLRVWIPGKPDQTRGLKMIIKFLDCLENKASPLRFVISKKYLPYLSAPQNFTFSPEYLDEKAYAELHAESQFILLFYDPIVYTSRTSGIFVEAIISKTIPIVLKGSWLAYELQKFGLDELVLSEEKVHPELIFYLKGLTSSEGFQKKFSKIVDFYRSYHSEENYKAIFSQILKNSICLRSSVSV